MRFLDEAARSQSAVHRQRAGIEPEGLVQPTGPQRPLAQQFHHVPAIGVGQSCQKALELRRGR
jgi:hypothetical protein